MRNHVRRENVELDIYEQVGDAVEPGYSIPTPTADPFDPYSFWWRRWTADWPGYMYEVVGTLRDQLFGDRAGDFFTIFFDRGMLTGARADTDFLRHWMVRNSATGIAYLVDFEPRCFDEPVGHIECFVYELDPQPVNHD